MRPLTRSTGIAALIVLILVIGIGINIQRTQKRAGTLPTPAASIPSPTTSATEQEVASVVGATKKTQYTEDDWKQVLTSEQYHILREAGTEAPFTSPLLNEHRPGTFVTADCNEPVFRSEQKFDSGTGWPSFWAPIKPDAVVEKTDTSLFEERTEVLSKCGGHLGHVFPDGPPPTGLRYCMNGAALKFIPDPVK